MKKRDREIREIGVILIILILAALSLVLSSCTMTGGGITSNTVYSAPGCEDYEGTARQNCNIRVAVETKDISICEELTDFKDACYMSLAIAANEKSVCENIESAETRSDCYSV